MRFVIKIGFALFLLCVGLPLMAQDDACANTVQTIIQEIGVVCDDMERNQACYGHGELDADLLTGEFSDVGTRAPLNFLQSITGTPYNDDGTAWGVGYMSLIPDIEGTTPRQNTRFLLMGDVRLTNSVEMSLISASTNSNANVRAEPSTNASIVAATTIGQELQIIGSNEAGDWYQILQDDGTTAWIFATLVNMDEGTQVRNDADLSLLEAFNVQTNQDERTCSEAPNVLILQTPENIQMRHIINGWAFGIHGTVAITTAPHAGKEVLVIHAIEAEVRARNGYAELRLSNQDDRPSAGTATTIAFMMDDEGMIQIEDLRPLMNDAQLANDLQVACEHAIATGLLEDITPTQCNKDMTFFMEPYAPTPFQVEFCQAHSDLIEGRPVVFNIGCCGNTSLINELRDQTGRGLPRLRLDGERLPPLIVGTRYIEQFDLLTNVVEGIWIPTAGEYTIEGAWGQNAILSCTFTVAPSE
jgi:hypothetical protein